MEQKGFEIPNHTQTPNTFFDVSLKEIKSLCELKVVLTVIRKTFGWQKRRERISLTQLEAMTGLTRQGVQRGVKLAVEHGYIERQAVGQGFFYSLVLGNSSYPAKVLPSQDHCLEVGNESSQQLGNRLDTQKKGIKEKKETPAFAVLMKHHADRVGSILDGGKQGSAIKRILSAGVSVDDAVACYEWVTTWSDAPDWATVQGKITPWLAKRNGNGAQPKKRTPEERKAWEAEQRRKHGWPEFNDRRTA